jgi:GTPase SAR1 family protein
VRKSNGLQIKQSEGKVSIYKTAWMIIGPPGVGKSTLASGFEDVLFLVTSEKELTRLDVPYILIESWEQLLQITDELVNNRGKYGYKFIAFDFVDAMFTMCDIAVCEKLGVQHKTDAAYGKGTDIIDGYFKKWVTQLVASDYGLLFISHVNQKDVIVSGGTITKTVCTLPIRPRNILFPLISIIGCIEYKTVKGVDKFGKPAIFRKRVMMFEGTDYIEAKDRTGVLPNEVILEKDPTKSFEKFKAFYANKK